MQFVSVKFGCAETFGVKHMIVGTSMLLEQCQVRQPCDSDDSEFTRLYMLVQRRQTTCNKATRKAVRSTHERMRYLAFSQKGTWNNEKGLMLMPNQRMQRLELTAAA